MYAFDNLNLIHTHILLVGERLENQVAPLVLSVARLIQL